METVFSQERFPVDKFTQYDSSFNDPANGAQNTFDLVIFNTCYHDLYNMDVSRPAFLASIKRSLTKQGRFLLIDARAAVGRGAQDAGSNKGLHRIEEDLVRKEGRLYVWCGGMISMPSISF